MKNFSIPKIYLLFLLSIAFCASVSSMNSLNSELTEKLRLEGFDVSAFDKSREMRAADKLRKLGLNESDYATYPLYVAIAKEQYKEVLALLDGAERDKLVRLLLTRCGRYVTPLLFAVEACCVNDQIIKTLVNAARRAGCLTLQRMLCARNAKEKTVLDIAVQRSLASVETILELARKRSREECDISLRTHNRELEPLRKKPRLELSAEVNPLKRKRYCSSLRSKNNLEERPAKKQRNEDAAYRENLKEDKRYLAFLLFRAIDVQDVERVNDLLDRVVRQGLEVLNEVLAMKNEDNCSIIQEILIDESCEMLRAVFDAILVCCDNDLDTCKKNLKILLMDRSIWCGTDMEDVSAQSLDEFVEGLVWLCDSVADESAIDGESE